MGARIYHGRGEWCRPRDWPKGDPRAGNVANPWYGVFSASWLDRIIALALPSQRVARVDAGKKALRALSSAAVKVCRKVWQQAAKLWVERARTEEERIKTTQARRVRAEKKVRQRRVGENRRRAIARVQESRNPIYRKKKLCVARPPWRVSCYVWVGGGGGRMWL